MKIYLQFKTICDRLTGGWLGSKKKPPNSVWWKRKEYKVLEGHQKVYVRHEQNEIQRYQRKVQYYNSSQLRHWILGATILIALITLGNKVDGSYSCSRQWNANKMMKIGLLDKMFPGAFCLLSCKQTLTRMITSHGINLWKSIDALKLLENAQKMGTVSATKDEAVKSGDTATDNGGATDDAELVCSKLYCMKKLLERNKNLSFN